MTGRRPLADVARDMAADLERLARVAADVAAPEDLERARTIAAGWRLMADTIGSMEPEAPPAPPAPPTWRIASGCGCFGDTDLHLTLGGPRILLAWCGGCGGALQVEGSALPFPQKREPS